MAGAPRGRDGKLPAAIILLSDGAQTRGILQPLDGAARAQKAGIRIYTIALGTNHGTLDLGNGFGGNFGGFGGQRIAVLPDPAILKAIAQATGGRAYTASSAAEAQRAYRTLGTSLTTRPGKREVSSWFAGAAAAAPARLARRVAHHRRASARDDRSEPGSAGFGSEPGSAGCAEPGSRP